MILKKVLADGTPVAEEAGPRYQVLDHGAFEDWRQSANSVRRQRRC